MELRGLAAAVCTLVLAPAAGAQTVATAESTPAGVTEAPREYRNVGLGTQVGGGAAFASDVPDAWMARLEYSAFPFLARRGTVGGLFGFLAGFQYWRGGADNWGISLPTAVVLGMRAVAVRGYLGVGLDIAGIDQVADDTGFVYAAPLALASLGLDIGGFTLMADARVVRRWQAGANDFTQWTLGVMLGGTFEPKNHTGAFY